MKLIFCTLCGDVIQLREKPRLCDCGASSGLYTDKQNATITGPCIPIGFANPSFIHALKRRPQTGDGERFEAFVIPVECKTVKAV